jgi:transcription antitermination protein NusB
MGRRTKARECAFQLLYQWEITGDPMDEVRAAFWRIRSGTDPMRAMAERLATGAQARAAELDAAIAEAATHWRLDRIATVDRTILRLGAFELLADAGTPSAVVIDEAVELAKRFGEADSPAFVNGVLDAIRRRVRGEAG